MVLGISEDPLDVTLQLGGILISILSLTKGVAEYQVTEAFAEDLGSPIHNASFLETLKCMAFVFPHTLVRVVSFTLVCAFLKFYATIPAALILTANTIAAIVTTSRNRNDDNIKDEERYKIVFLYGTVLAGLCAPFTVAPRSSSHRLYLRVSLLTTNLILLPSLVFIFFLPSIIPPEILIQTQGFQHLNLNISGEQFLVNESEF